jgi:actin cytoskeleton-regulatory complex protein SLA1
MFILFAPLLLLINSEPDPSKIRTWTDRSKSFSVEAQFLGLKDAKINLHKMNGVKIAVPVAKMSVEDLDYVESLGVSLDGLKPPSNSKSSKSSLSAANSSSRSAVVVAGAGATVEQPRKPEYDWFQFFLSCDVAVGLCERYAQAFIKDSMDESVLPDVDAGILRNLGLREGDIIKVMRTLDNRFARTAGKGKRNVSFAGDQGEGEADGEAGAAGGLFSGPGGTLRNNTRKGRPAPAIVTSDVVDPKAFSQRDGGKDDEGSLKSPSSPATATTPSRRAGGFDDDAWDVKPAKQQPQQQPTTISAPAAAPTPVAAAASQTAAEPALAPSPPAPLSASMQELSLLTTPLQPTKIEPPRPAQEVALPSNPPAAQVQVQGATPSFFPSVAPQVTGVPNGQFSRMRPAVPQPSSGPGSLIPPPPPRPLSAPQSAQPSAFALPPLAPQMTGVPHAPLQAQVAPMGQSLNEITQVRMQQQYAQQLQMQPTGINPYPIQVALQGMAPYSTGVPQQGQFMQPMMTGIPLGQSPFADPIRSTQFSPIQAQPTGFSGQFASAPSFVQPPPPGGINSFLPPPLEPQRTGMPFQQQPPPQLPAQAAAAGFSAMGGQGLAPPQPLVPQQTGPAPPVRFGVTGEVKKLAPQPTGRRANLSAASK